MSEPRGTIGASDIAALFGEHPYESAFSLFLRETGQRAHEDDETTPRQQIGLDLEPAILAAWGRDENQDVRHNRLPWRHRHIRGASATPDGLISRQGSFVATAQVKTVQPWERAKYLAGVPRHHFLQVQQEIGCLSVELGYLVCQFGFNERAATCIEIDHEVQQQIADKIGHFWRQVAGEVPPPEPDDHRASLAAQMERKRERRIVDFSNPSIVDIMTKLDEEYIAAAKNFRAAEKRVKAAKIRILNALSDADAGAFADGSGYRVETIVQNRKATEAKQVIQRKLTRFVGDNTEEGEDNE